ncbi:hypothetical protein [Rhodoferax sp. GW822-FHT02A01]|uniref:hypothetical protein n=1 Tax=Rhodoferax sp. GW822-FHT02A01 TaxID=3141537 RepID=UPI00315DF13C
MSADSHVTYPYDLRSFNRYSFVYNNSLKFFDPTGYDAWSHENSDGSSHYNLIEHGHSIGSGSSGSSNGVGTTASAPITDPNSTPASGLGVLIAGASVLSWDNLFSFGVRLESAHRHSRVLNN